MSTKKNQERKKWFLELAENENTTSTISMGHNEDSYKKKVCSAKCLHQNFETSQISSLMVHFAALRKKTV